MAHSLGNEVLINVLDQCGQAGTEIDHVFMWEGAIPNNSFETAKRQYFPMTMDKQTLNYGYNYPNAQKGAKAYTVLYSDHDNILGAMPGDKPAAQPQDWTNKTIHDFYYSLMSIEEPKINTALNSAIKQGNASLPIWLKADGIVVSNLTKWMWHLIQQNVADNDTDHVKNLAGKISDPAAGIKFAAIAEALYIMDSYLLPEAKLHIKLFSIYHVANLMVYPLSYFMDDSIKRCEDYYAAWQSRYQTYTAIKRKPNTFWEKVDHLSEEVSPARLITGVPAMPEHIEIIPKQTLPRDFESQKAYLKANMPDVFNLLSVGFYIAQKLMDSGSLGVEDYLGMIGAGNYELWLRGDDINFNDPIGDAIATVLITALMTPQASPVPALGYSLNESGSGPAEIGKLFPASMESKVHPVPQGALLPDHSGMMIPNQGLFDEIYKIQLMGGIAPSFKKFGQWLG